MSKRIFDDDSEISYKWSKRYMLDRGKGSHSKKHYNDYGQKEKKRYLNRPCSVNAFKPFLPYCASCHEMRCGLVLLRRALFSLGLDTAYGMAKAVL